MSTVKTVVELTQQQWEQLYKTGQTLDKDGVTRTLDTSGNTYYSADLYDEVIGLNNRIDRILAGNIPSTEQLIQKTIEEARNNEIAENPTLANRTCIGIKALLSKNDTVHVDNNIMYINGVLRDIDYTYSGNNQEYVTILYFSNGSNLILSDNPTYNIMRCEIWQIDVVPNINQSYFAYSNTLKLDGYFSPNCYGVRKLYIKNILELCPSVSDFTGVEYLYSEAKRSTNGNAFFVSKKTVLKYIDLPELTQIGGTVPFSGLPAGCELNIPKVETIAGYSANTNATFNALDSLVLPETVTSITGRICLANKSVTLNCKHATIDDNWYASSAPTTLNLCEDWQTSINLAVAGTQQNADWYKDLLENKLATVSTSKYIKVPSAMFNTLNTTPCTVEGFSGTWIQYATSKGWNVTS